MSIATRVVPFSRSFRTLIKNARNLSKSIKDLKDLSVLRVCASYRHSGLTDLKRTRDVFSLAGTLARDRPSPYGEGAFFSRSAGACPPRWPSSRGGVLGPLGPKRRFFVVRGPVPCERWIARARTLARDRPSPYDEGRLSAAAAPVSRAYPRKRG